MCQHAAQRLYARNARARADTQTRTHTYPRKRSRVRAHAYTHMRPERVWGIVVHPSECVCDCVLSIALLCACLLVPHTFLDSVLDIRGYLW